MTTEELDAMVDGLDGANVVGGNVQEPALKTALKAIIQKIKDVEDEIDDGGGGAISFPLTPGSTQNVINTGKGWILKTDANGNIGLAAYDDENNGRDNISVDANGRFNLNDTPLIDGTLLKTKVTLSSGQLAALGVNRILAIPTAGVEKVIYPMFAFFKKIGSVAGAGTLAIAPASNGYNEAALHCTEDWLDFSGNNQTGSHVPYNGAALKDNSACWFTASNNFSGTGSLEVTIFYKILTL